MCYGFITNTQTRTDPRTHTDEFMHAHTHTLTGAIHMRELLNTNHTSVSVLNSIYKHKFTKINKICKDSKM